ncbi:hypothetical protein [Actinoplanes sp. TBRC 11911]|uniref:hypothetical protein n=1 Tax=Actinoplanes sp. TBRC 11911 TaxID=2729386 RepID=UPI00289FC82B|nr:hypothetical protein [Actinoplanes sp. TBRC 11911]
MTGLSDAERDANDVMRALEGLAALARRPAAGPGSAAALDDDTRRLLLGIAEDAGEAAARVLSYLRDQRGCGDGDLAAVPPRLGQWREWVPARGHLFGVKSAVARGADEVPQPRRSDPGE